MSALALIGIAALPVIARVITLRRISVPLTGHRTRGFRMRAAAILMVPMLSLGCAQDGDSHVITRADSEHFHRRSDHAAQIENWRHLHRSAFTTLGIAASALGDALVAKVPDWTTIHAACAKLNQATQPMSDALPSPDERLNVALKGMLDDMDSQ